MYISKLTLRNWRNFKDFEADLWPRVFIVGPNAVGKSNLLDAIRFLRDVATPGGGLSAAVAKRGGVSRIRSLYARASDVSVAVSIANDDRTTAWRYEVAFTQDNNSRPIVSSEAVWNAHEKVVLRRPDDEDKKDPVRRQQTSLEQIVANREFRGVSQFLQSVAYRHTIPQAVRAPRDFSPQPVQDDPFGRDFLFSIYNTKKNSRDSKLKRITEVLQAAVPQLESLDVQLDPSAGVPHLVARFKHWRSRAAKQSEGELSDGTLRLLGLLWAALEGTGPLLLEEPELSLHPELARRLPGLFWSAMRSRKKVPRQVFISTYSREMMDDEGVSPDEVLVLRPTQEGTVLERCNDADRALFKHRLTVADVLLPKAEPQLQETFTFS